MKARDAEIPNKVENPFLRAPYSPLYVAEPFKPGASKADLLRRLKTCLAQMDTLCFDKDATLRSAEIFWPSQAWLDELSEIIWRLSSLHRRGGQDLWGCVKAIDNRYSKLTLSRKIAKFVDRAAKIYCEPLAIAIQRQAISGNQAAHGCFAALQRCHDGRSKISSESWDPYREILRPLPDETCAARAEHFVADWRRDALSPEKPSDDLASWLSTLGNRPLAEKLIRPDSAYAFYAIVSEYDNRSRPKKLAAMRQKKYRQRMSHPIQRALMRFLGTPAKRTRLVKAKK